MNNSLGKRPSKFKGKIYEVGQIFETTLFGFKSYIVVTHVYLESETYATKVLYPENISISQYVSFGDIGKNYGPKPIF